MIGATKIAPRSEADMRKTTAKKILDSILLCLFFAELAGMFLPHPVHDVLGCLFIALIVLHNIKNHYFYTHFLVGTYSPLRLANNISIILFAASLIILTLSGMVLSQYLFPWFSLASTWNWRALHLGAAIGALVLLFVHLLLHARRYIHGRMFFGLAGTAFVLAAAGIFGMPYLDRWYHQVNVEKNAVIAGDKVSIPGRVLTVYFSRVGNTNFPSDVDAVSGASIMKDRHEIIGNAEMIAYMVQDAAGGDIFAIQTEKTYPADYGETTKEGKRELESGKAPTLKGTLPQMENYDVIFLVYPLWWNTLPMPVEGFLKQYDWTGKILVPIVTHGGGGTGESLKAIQEVTQTKTAESYLDIYSSDIPAARQEITDYLKKLR